MHVISFVDLEYICVPVRRPHFRHLIFDPGIMFVDETAELGLLSLLTELVVLKSYLDEEVLCKSLVFEVMILVD